MTYYYLDRYNKQAGPIDPAQFRSYGVTASTMVWCQGMPNWMPAGQVPELAPYVGGGATPPPAPFGGGNNNVAPPKPDNGLVWAILSTVLCCLPIGIYSIILAAKVDGLYKSGQYDEAQKAADDAKKWAGIGAGVGLVVSVLYMIATLAGGLN